MIMRMWINSSHCIYLRIINPLSPVLFWNARNPSVLDSGMGSGIMPGCVFRFASSRPHLLLQMDRRACEWRWCVLEWRGCIWGILVRTFSRPCQDHLYYVYTPLGFGDSGIPVQRSWAHAGRRRAPPADGANVPPRRPACPAHDAGRGAGLSCLSCTGIAGNKMKELIHRCSE